jgi:hypothetical protein
MGATSFPSNPLSVIKHQEEHIMHIAFENGNDPTQLLPGTEVYISDDNEVKKRETADKDKFPIGLVQNSSRTSTKVVLCLDFSAIIERAVVKTGAIAAGVFVVPLGADTDGQPHYQPAVADDFAKGIAITGGSVDDVIRIGILRNPVKV